MSFFDRLLSPEPNNQGILTGPEIMRQRNLGHITIEPFTASNINPNSYNLRIGDTVRMYDDIHVFDLKDPTTFDKTRVYRISEDGFTLRPGNLYLIPTHEIIGSDIFEPIITGRSSAGRLGIRVHQEAGFCDIGYEGRLTMQMQVTYPTKIYPYLPIAQIYFLTAVGEIMPYKGRYQKSTTEVSSKGVEV